MSASEPFTVLTGGPTIEERDARLSAGAEELVDDPSRLSIFRRDHFLLAVAAALMSLGIAVILIGWAGAAHATIIEEQLPYVISGGLLGVALATIGALTLFSHWLTVTIRENRVHEASRRRDHAELVDAIRSLTKSFDAQEEVPRARAGSKRADRQVRRTPRS